eukprot:768433-Hanusia_phi.AAC.4
MAARRLLTLMAATGACAFMAPPSSPPGLVASPRLLSAPSSFRGYRRNAAGGLRMGGSNVPRVPYKAPGDQVYQARTRCDEQRYGRVGIKRENDREKREHKVLRAHVVALQS